VASAIANGNQATASPKSNRQRRALVARPGGSAPSEQRYKHSLRIELSPPHIH
jgi:hypothetical protein